MRAKKLGATGAPVVLTFAVGPNAALLTTPDVSLFIADGDYEVASVSEVHEVAGTDGGAVALDVVKCTTTQAAAAGASVLASTFNLKSTANTVVKKTNSNAGLSATTANRRLRSGDRLALAFSGTRTSLVGMLVQVTLIRNAAIAY